MFGNYPVNDDWVFFWQIKAFASGIFKLNAEIDPSFVAQGFLGLLWSKVFGLNYISLQVLTFLLTAATCFFIYKILTHLDVKKSIVWAAVLIYFFNPLVFASAFTFMTDNYLLFFLSGAAYFLVKYLRQGESLALGLIFGVLAAATRQIGIFIFLAFFLARLSKKEKFNVKETIFFLLSVVIAGYTAFLWPRFGSNDKFLEFKNITGRLELLIFIPQYLLIFLSPVLIGLKPNLKPVSRTLIYLFLVLAFSYLLYKTDFFPIGNVLYLEEMYSKSDFRSNFNILNNLFIKSGLAIIWALGISNLVMHLFSKVKKIQLPDPPVLFLLISAGLNLGVLLFSSDFYDRYIMPTFFYALIFTVINLRSEINLNTKLVYCSIAPLLIIATALQWEFIAKNRIMWGQLDLVRAETGLSTGIDLNDTYINHISVRESGDLTGLQERRGSFEPECYIQDYTSDSSWPFVRKIEAFANKVADKTLGTPRPLGVRKKSGPRIKNNLDALIHNEEYFSILYGAVGKKAFVGSFCVKD